MASVVNMCRPMRLTLLLSFIMQSTFSLISKPQTSPRYLVGSGIADITGPAAEVDLMGYANPAQTAQGIHLRQYSRAFIFADLNKESQIVFVSTDSCMISQGVKLEVVKRLKEVYGDLYTERNLCLSGIHTHSGPGGFHQYLLYDITSLGFVKESFEALVSGIVESIHSAYKNLVPGNVFMNSGELLDSNINRSPSAYLANPLAERERYKYDVDKNMTVLLMVNATGDSIGMISWFAVHCTSMNNTNRLISSDNKGYASQMFEKVMNNGAPPGQGSFIAAFAQSNEGDVSPNTKGPHCQDTGKPCDILTSTCHGENELCVASGPGRDMFESTKIIAENQFQKAMDLAKTASVMLEGPVDYRHTYVDMTSVEVLVNDTIKITTCSPAMGYSFAAGTTDGPGAFDFKQGTTTGNPFWNFVSDFLKKPSAEQVSCQHPKPILLDTGEMHRPYQWEPEIVDTQILRIGQLAIAAVPAEFSTMSGRRMRETVTSTLRTGGFPTDTVTVIAGLANDYASYVATFEEYQIQRYEGASTIYGPHTLSAYLQKFKDLALALAKGSPSPLGPNPPNLLSQQLSFLPPVLFDHAPFGYEFGSVTQDANPEYFQGSEVTVKFVSGNPRNDIKRNSTFLTVQQENESDGQWNVVYTDSVWETKFKWQHTNFLLGESEAIITWAIPEEETTGTYRICHYGNHKSIDGNITPFEGCSGRFSVKQK